MGELSDELFREYWESGVPIPRTVIDDVAELEKKLEEAEVKVMKAVGVLGIIKGATEVGLEKLIEPKEGE